MSPIYPSIYLFIAIVAVSGGHFEAQAKLAITNGSFELPQMEETIPQGTHGTIDLSNPDQRFYAVGPRSPILPPPVGSLFIFFQDKPYHMAFDPPHFAGYVTDSGIGFTNGWAETSYRKECYEVGFDPGATMWIEQAHPARVVVRFRGSLSSEKGDIARANLPSGSPYGPGDWADEWFYIYPDGVSTRVVQIYTGAAKNSQAFWSLWGGRSF